MRDQVPYPYKTTGNYDFREEKGIQETLNWMTANNPEFSLLLMSSWMQLWFATVVPKCF